MNEKERYEAWSRSWDAAPFLTDDAIRRQLEADEDWARRVETEWSTATVTPVGDPGLACPVCERSTGGGLCPRCERWWLGDGSDYWRSRGDER